MKSLPGYLDKAGGVRSFILIKNPVFKLTIVNYVLLIEEVQDGHEHN